MDVQGLTLIGDDIALPRSELILIFSENTVEQAVKRKQIIAISRGNYSFNSFSDSWKTKVLTHLGFESVNQLIAEIKAKEEQERKRAEEATKGSLVNVVMRFFDIRDVTFYKQKFADSTVKDVGKKSKDLAISCAMMRMLHAYKYRHEIKQELGFNSREEQITACCNLVKELDLYSMPINYDRLRIKYYNWVKLLDNKQDAREIFVPSRLGNQNRREFDDTHVDIFLEQWFSPNKLTVVAAYNNYKHIVENELRLKPMSLGLAKLITLRNDVQAEASMIRHGSSHYETYTRPFVLRKAPEYSFSLVTGDGWVPGQRVRYQWRNPKTKMLEERIGTMSVWVWFDWKTKAVLSYDIAPAEDSAQIRTSFRHILNLHGVCPASAMVDKKWTKNPETVQMFSKLNVQIEHKRGYNPKANIAERMNKEMNKFHREMFDNWINRTPGVSANNRNNDDLQRGAKPMDEAEFRAGIKDLINIYNNEPLRGHVRSKLSLLHDKVSPFASKPDPLQILEAFANISIVTVRNKVFTLTIASKKYEYEIPDWLGFINRNIKNNKIKVYWDEKFLEEVAIYKYCDEHKHEDDIFLYQCKQVTRINAASIEMTEKDWAEFHRQQADIKNFDQALKQRGAERKAKLVSLELDHLTVRGVSQEVHKEALQSEGAVMFDTYFNEHEREAGRKPLVKKPKAESKELVPISVEEKYRKLKDVRFDD